MSPGLFSTERFFRRTLLLAVAASMLLVGIAMTCTTAPAQDRHRQPMMRHEVRQNQFQASTVPVPTAAGGAANSALGVHASHHKKKQSKPLMRHEPRRNVPAVELVEPAPTMVAGLAHGTTAAVDEGKPRKPLMRHEPRRGVPVTSLKNRQPALVRKETRAYAPPPWETFRARVSALRQGYMHGTFRALSVVFAALALVGFALQAKSVASSLLQAPGAEDYIRKGKKG